LSLRCVNIHVSFEQRKILHAVDLSVGDGELVSLLGPSGCGKSTLLKTIAGLITPDEGDVLIDGESTGSLPVHRRGAVIVFQDLRLFPHMTVEDNVAFPLKMQGMAKAARLIKARGLLEKVQLGGFGCRSVDQMSGGQLQRVALARALAASPKILLLDEPFSSLDESLRQDMRGLVVQLHRETGISTVLVTHDPREALMISDRIAVMFDGRIVQYGTARELYNAPATHAVADYFGQTSYIDGRVTCGVFKSSIISFSVAVADGDYRAMLRPAAIRLAAGRGDYKVAGIDYLGDYCSLTLCRGEISLLLSVPASKDVRIGDMVAVEFDTSGAVLFKQ